MKPSCLNKMFDCHVSCKLCAFLYQRGGASLIVARSRRSLGSRKGYMFEAAQKVRRRFFTNKKVFSTNGKFHYQIFPLRKNSYSTVSIIFYRFTFFSLQVLPMLDAEGSVNSSTIDNTIWHALLRHCTTNCKENWKTWRFDISLF